MKKIITLLGIVFLFCGTTFIQNKKKILNSRKNAIEQLSEIANSMDSTAVILNHSSKEFKKLN